MRSAPRRFPQRTSLRAHGRVGRKDRRDSWGGNSEQARPVGGYARRARGKCSTRGAGNGSSITGEFVFNPHEETLLCIVAREP
mgnify:CR=1 FL=1